MNVPRSYATAGLAVCSLALLLTAAQPVRRSAKPAASSLEQRFKNPPPTERPWVYYWWIKGNVTRQSITRDLEQMKAKGIGGFLLFDARGYGEDHLPPPPAPMEFLSPKWRDMVRFTISEAHRLGLQMSMNLSTHGGSLRAPWKTGANAPKKLIWTSTEIAGGRRFELDLVKPNQPYFWDVALLAVQHDSPGTSTPGAAPLAQNWRDIIFDRKSPGESAREIVDLADKISSGHLAWDVPEGNWTILRFGAVTMEDHQTDVDILNAKAVDDHFQRMGRLFLGDAGPLAGKTLTYFYNVSWEGASPTWTPGFDQDFLKYRGYNYRFYLPVLAGMTVKDDESSSRFLEDYSRTLGDCFLNNCYRRLGDLCHKAGIQWHSESGGPWDREKPLFRFSDQLAFWGANDMPQGEFWHDRWEMKPDGTRVWLSNMRRTAMAAHIYGRPLVAAESFTNMNPHWQEYPAVLKPDIDTAFVDGTNQVVWHTFDGSPAAFGKPGIVYFAGTHLNPNVTWWEDAGPFLSYLGRAQVMLREGRFVADACVYTSDHNYLRWGRDKTWGDRASLELPPGYSYDLINTEVLLNRLSVSGGSLVLPDGMSYRVLVLDLEDNVMPAAALAKVVELARAGATVVLGRRQPERSPGLEAASARDAQIAKLAAELWGESEAQPVRSFGKGRVIRGLTLEAALQGQNIQPDFAGPFEYIHRRAGETDIYFLKGSGRAECRFRVSGKEPELWDAVSGSVRDAPAWRATEDGRTLVPVILPENGSVFVVFRRPASTGHLTSLPANEGIRWDGRPLLLDGPWQVTFAPGLGAPASASFDHLTPWNENSESGIRYFSGTATYRKTFELDSAQADRLIRLQLGEVKDIARVRLNGKPLGVVWTAPWTVDLTGIAKPGANDLEIDVTNTWVNRLIGDAALPENERITKTIVRRSPDYKGRYPYLRGYLATDPLLRSGLIGPVKVEFGEKQQ
jgi:hypothetical protein